MRRDIEITSHIVENGEEVVTMSVDQTGITLSDDRGQSVSFTSEQWLQILDEWTAYQRIVEASASSMTPRLPIAAE